MTDDAAREPRHVLVVDDAPELRLVAQLSLSRVGGFEVELAGSGEEALACVAARVPDVVLLDLTMPGIGGRETLIRMRAMPSMREAIIIVLSANAGPTAELLALGATGVLEKPFDPMALPDAVRRIARGER